MHVRLQSEMCEAAFGTGGCTHREISHRDPSIALEPPREQKHILALGREWDGAP